MDVASVAVFFFVPLRSLLLTFHTMLLLTRGLKSEQVIYLNSLFRTIERRLAPRNPSGPPENDPSMDVHTDMCGLERGGGGFEPVPPREPARAAKPQAKTRPQRREELCSAEAREERTVGLRGIQRARCRNDLASPRK